MMGWLLNRGRLLADQKKLGRWGERRCESFLKKKGFRKLAHNFSCKSGEIDLIMVDTNGAIVFVEVRTKTDESFSSPEESVTYSKKEKLLRTARYFLATHNIENRPFRFDVITVVLGQKGRPQIKHYENAFVR
jgi:putative endonuclease